MDELLQVALKYTATQEHISVGMLQRRMRIIYPTAARLLDEMKARGLIPQEPEPGRQIYKVNAAAIANMSSADPLAMTFPCLLCGEPCRPAPTARGWMGWGPGGRIHFDCIDMAKIGADNMRTAPVLDMG